jgi:glutamyl-tRNA synthetase
VLGIPVPGHVHVPLVLGPDGERLAKRHGAVTRSELEAAGMSAGRLVGVLASSLGLADAREEIDAATLLGRFDPGSLPTTPWIFDPQDHL